VLPARESRARAEAGQDCTSPGLPDDTLDRYIADALGALRIARAASARSRNSESIRDEEAAESPLSGLLERGHAARLYVTNVGPVLCASRPSGPCPLAVDSAGVTGEDDFTRIGRCSGVQVAERFRDISRIEAGWR
jgi:hypothetical protein